MRAAGKEAPFHTEITDGPAGGFARWLHTADGIRIRAAFWPVEGARGTVLILPGRTEYVEKYGPAAARLAAQGFAAAALDWRGQGLSDRLTADPRLGHIGDFADYQHDLQALLEAMDSFGLPGPHFLLAHSMGGCIGLRALIEQRLNMCAAAFCAPMWGVLVPNGRTRQTEWMANIAVRLGFSRRYAPAPETGPASYVETAPLDANMLTSDPERMAWMKAQLRAHPELALGGPSLGWVHAALRECRMLAALPCPDLPAVAMVGTREAVIDPRTVKARMAHWPQGTFRRFDDAEHELLMERPEIRERVYDTIIDLFSGRQAAEDTQASAQTV